MILNKLFSWILLTCISHSTFSFIDKLYNDSDEHMKSDDDYYNQESLVMENRIYKPGIKTLYGHPETMLVANPIITLNSEDRLVVHFDDLNEQLGDYYYTIIHCSFNWEPSDLMKSEYIDGFPKNPVNDYINSFNTFVPYVNYQVTLPNNDCRFLKSGNYILYVFENNDEEQPVLSYRFTMVENLVSTDIDISRPADVDEMNYKQEVDFTINHTAYPISDPFREVKVAVLQNYRWDNAITDLQPQFIQNNKLVYDYSGDGTFYGNNEFRYLDLKSVRYRGEKIDYIKMEEGIYNFYMLPEVKRSYLQYLSARDINGLFLIRDENEQNSQTDADYVTVHLSLASDQPFDEGNVYVYGALSNWRLDPNFKMTYNTEARIYEADLVVKQGYYNYLYAVPGKDGTPNTRVLEGSHYETENQYTILVYQTIPSEGYDRVIGMGQANSRQNNR